ncbi:MAG TPA: OsmC family protein [Anaerolineales bacterium]|nr:OsmC family protein [Anaerolineales bacterium]
MEITIDFPGGARVDAHFRGHDLPTDQPVRDGGEDSAPMPFDLFLASIATCVGYYVLKFCQQRDLPTEDIRITQNHHPNRETGLMGKINIEIQVPASFPKQYHSALIRSAELCKVKKSLENPPQLEITTKEVDTG